jgi:hexosaminidase
MTGLPVVPTPLRVTLTDGPGFPLDARTRVVAGAQPEIAAVVAHRLSVLTGIAVPVAAEDDDAPGAVVLHVADDPAALHEPDASGASDAYPDGELDPGRAAGAYRLDVTTHRVVVTALAVEGLLNAVSTLEQAATLPVAVPDDLPVPTVPAMLVVDVPRFAWRGLSLDVARHFFGVDVLRQVVDVMASLRLNHLHLHLTDDQGWRVEVPSRPLLTERSGATAVDGDPGGSYTTDELAELTAYAASRGITVVPEVDLPGHVNAALHAYGELTPSGEPTEAYTGIEVGFSRLHADLPATDPFLRDVLTDVATATPGPYVHIGGDEVHTMEAAEYAALVEAAARHVEAAGKTVVAWQEAAKARLTPGTVLQLWDERESTEHVVAAVAAGARLLLSPASKVYVDLKYDASTVLGLEWAGHVELRDSYDWEPLDVVPGVPEASVIGVEAALWTETVRTPDDLFFLLLPRLAAVAEVAWSAPGNRSWDAFVPRVRTLAGHWDRAGLHWYRSPQVEW